MKKKLFMVALMIISLSACKSTAIPTEDNDKYTPGTKQAEPSTTIFTIAPKKVDCIGVAPMKCLMVKEGKTSDWSFMYQGIEGFDFQEGFEYVIEVKRTKIANPPADGSSIRYTLVKIISKTAKE
ncbi:MAG: DUF4377 domain-containing protein [Flavobacteriaceae bacterium]|nr:DUF4377 domain-containing protein [Flavobacteriaceae bacterium]